MLTIERLKEFGADTEEGLARCMNNEALYLKLVRLSVEEPNLEGLNKALAEGNADQAFECAHALKGVFANLSLTPVLKPVEELTERFRPRQMTEYEDLLHVINEKTNELKCLIAEG